MTKELGVKRHYKRRSGREHFSSSGVSPITIVREPGIIFGKSGG
jgi:hypothetical protein